MKLKVDEKQNMTPQEILDEFDLSPLWQEEETGGFTKMAPVLSLFLNVILLIVLLVKK